ncbi:MAG: peptidase domain-containing ABC transporter [Candidatus Wallbacteria bacterium]|nr:peptidase domain-containing ABC transporter [Candidatus Wallbacteria bacterium]
MPDGPPAKESDSRPMNLNDLLIFIRKVPNFSIYREEDLSRLLAAAELVRLSAGEELFRQGERGDTFYIILSGKIRILQTNEAGREINLGIRNSTDHIGARAIITDEPRIATARAVDDSLLLSIGRDAFTSFISSKPELKEYFDKFFKHISIFNFLKSCTDLSSIDPGDLQELVLIFNSEFFKEQEAVFRQGAEPDKFYLIEKGKAKVVRWQQDKQEIINFLHEGQFFGEKALFEDTKRYADVVCLTDCHLFSLSRQDFNRVLSRSPVMKKIIEGRIRSYSSEPPLPYQEIIKQELGARARIRVSRDGEEGFEGRTEKPFSLHNLFYSRLSFPFIMQHDQMSCGTTCLQMIARFYGKNIGAERLRELAHVDRSGASLANLAQAAEQMGFNTRGLKLDYNSLKTVRLPAVVHWQGYHYLVVYSLSDTHVCVADPAMGKRKYTRDYFCSNWNGITLTLEPAQAFNKEPEDNFSITGFLQFVSPHWLTVLEIFAASLLLNLFGLATPIFTKNIIDRVLLRQSVTLLNVMFVGMLIVIVFRMLTMLVRQYLTIHTVTKIDLKMLTFFYRHLLNLPLSYFQARKTGDFLNRFQENSKIRNFFTNTALTLVLDTILIAVYFALMFYYNFTLTWFVILFIPVCAILTLLFTPVLKRLNLESLSARSDVESHLVESINGIETIKAANLEYPVRWKWENKFIRSLNIDFNLNSSSLYFQALGDFAATFGSTFILWYGAHLVLLGQLSIGELMAFMALMGSVITPVIRVIASWDSLQQAHATMERLSDMLSARTEFPSTLDEPGGLILPDPKGEIVLENVFFRYGGADSPQILSNVSLRILPGQTVAIIGRSGSGKTTLARLLCRLHETTSGRILIDGFEVKTIDLNCLRKMIGFVLQDNFIFDTSIRENISLGDPEETLSRVIEAARLANAHEFIMNLTLGYETRIGESGLKLSCGQKQRIAIARALYTRPRILVLDEATSSLDIESEQAIQQNLKGILKDRTALIIAHRISTIRNADLIIVLDNGEVVEQGTHQELMERNGLYHYLAHQQLNI